MVRHICA